MEQVFTSAMVNATMHAAVRSTVDANTLPDVDYNDFTQLWFTNYIDHNDLTAGTF